MGFLCSKPAADKEKGPAITDVDRAILSLKAQRKKLADQQKLLELRIERHTEVARELVKEKQNTKALLVLKKKKLTEKQLEQLSTLQLTTESLISDVEMSKHTNNVFSVLKQGNEVMQKLQKEVTVDDVRKLMDDTAEAKAYQDEMMAALNQETLSSDDSEAINTELEALEAEALQAQVESMPTAPEVPEEHKAKVEAAAQAAAQAGQASEPAQEEEVEEEAPPKVALLAS